MELISSAITSICIRDKTYYNFQVIRMSKESKRTKEENERKLKTFENEDSALLVNLCFTGILTTLYFHCLVILALRYWQFHVFIVFKFVIEFTVFCQVYLKSLTIIEIGIISYLCIPNLSVILYFVTS